MSVKLLTEHHLEFLSLKGGCTGLSESIHVKMPHCWKSHVAAQILYTNEFYHLVGYNEPGPEVIKLFSCSTQLSMKFILLINVKMPTNVGILTFLSLINTTSERLKARNFFICWYFSFYEQLKFPAQLS